MQFLPSCWCTTVILQTRQYWNQMFMLFLLRENKNTVSQFFSGIIQNPFVSVWYYHMPYFRNVETQDPQLVDAPVFRAHCWPAVPAGRSPSWRRTGTPPPPPCCTGGSCWRPAGRPPPPHGSSCTSEDLHIWGGVLQLLMIDFKED